LSSPDTRGRKRCGSGSRGVNRRAGGSSRAAHCALTARASLVAGHPRRALGPASSDRAAGGAFTPAVWSCVVFAAAAGPYRPVAWQRRDECSERNWRRCRYAGGQLGRPRQTCGGDSNNEQCCGASSPMLHGDTLTSACCPQKCCSATHRASAATDGKTCRQRRSLAGRVGISQEGTSVSPFPGDNIDVRRRIT
jgi:hypothetical protein